MDVKAWAEQVVGNVHHFDFPDIEGVGTEFDALVQSTFQCCGRLGNAWCRDA